MKDILINSKLESVLVRMLEKELQYFINESGCALEYEENCRAKIELLRLMGYRELAGKYSADLRRHLAKNLIGKPHRCA